MTETAVELEFTPFPKIGRLEKDMIVTEKIDGTNAAVVCTEDGIVYAQSRTRVITPENDNFGFARWVRENVCELFEGLGPGVHFGEWWGKGIQRGYGLDERRFSLFNTRRWTSVFNERVLAGTGWSTALVELDNEGWTRGGMHQCNEVPCCNVVPVLEAGTFSTLSIQSDYSALRTIGSAAAEFLNPEGVVVYHTAQGVLFKLSDAKAPPRG